MNTVTITSDELTTPTRQLLLAQARAGHVAPRVLPPAAVRAIANARARLDKARCDREIASAEGFAEGALFALREAFITDATQTATALAELRTLGQRCRDALRHARTTAGKAA